MVKQFSVFEAKARLSELLRYVKQGVEIIVTERGKPIARVTQLEPDKGLVGRVSKLKDQGSIIPRKSTFWPKLKKVKGALNRFLKERE